MELFNFLMLRTEIASQTVRLHTKLLGVGSRRSLRYNFIVKSFLLQNQYLMKVVSELSSRFCLTVSRIISVFNLIDSNTQGRYNRMVLFFYWLVLNCSPKATYPKNLHWYTNGICDWQKCFYLVGLFFLFRFLWKHSIQRRLRGLKVCFF